MRRYRPIPPIVLKLLTPKMLSITLLSIASGVPLGVVLTLIQTWLTDAGIDLKTIGLISLVQLPYTLKFLWSPLVDRYRMPFLGRRQGWMLVAQIGMIATVAALSFFDPSQNVLIISAIAIAISFFGATHDIVIDAYKRDVFDTNELGFGAALANNAYLIGFRFLTVVLGLALADTIGWTGVFLMLAGACLLGVIGTFIAPEGTTTTEAPKSIVEAIINPFVDYLTRPGAFEILAFILLFKIGDNFAANLVTTFYIKIGFTKPEIAAVGKLIGFWATFIGGLVGGAALLRYSIRNCLFWFGIFQAVSTLAFAFLNEYASRASAIANSMASMMAALPGFDPSHPIGFLGFVVAVENFTTGMGTAAYAAFMLRLCDKRFSATQFALLSSFMSIPRSIVPAAAGYVAEPFGWTNFFIFSTLLAAPGILMVYFRAKKWEESLPAA